MNATLRSGLRRYSALRTQIDACLLGDEGEVFAREFGKCAAKKSSWTLKKPGSRIFTLNLEPINPESFIGKSWSIWRGPPKSNGLEGDEVQDGRSLELSEVDMNSIRFENMLNEEDGETTIKGEEKIFRLKMVKSIRLDVRLGRDLFAEPEQATLEWLYRERGVTWFDLPGTILRGPFGKRCVLYLCRGDVRWYWDVDWLENVWGRSNPSAVLAP